MDLILERYDLRLRQGDFFLDVSKGHVANFLDQFHLGRRFE